MVFVAGEAGVGKSSLVRAFCAQLEPGVPVHVGLCDALGTPRALGPLFDMAGTSLPGLAPWLADSADRHAIFTAFLERLGSGPSVTVIEDVHWADEATLDLLLFVGRRIGGVPATVVVTYRAEEVGREHPLQRVLGDLATAERVRRLTVPALSREAVEALAAPSGRDGAELYAVTGGNPFFVTEVLGAPVGQTPGTVRDAVLVRVARLGAGVRAVLDVVSLVPDRIELSLLAAVAEVEATVLDDCVSAGMLVVEGGTIRFRHELARRAIEASVPAGRAAGLHSRVLAHLVAMDVVDPARLAYHAEAAGDAEAVLEHAPAAALRATSLGAHREAAAQYARALRHADRATPQVRAQLWDARVCACLPAGELADALEGSVRAVELWRDLGSVERQAVMLARRSFLLSRTARYAEAHETARAAIALLEPLPPGRALAVAYAAHARLLMLARDVPKAIELGLLAVDLAERAGDDSTIANALTTVGSAYWFADADRAVELLEQSLEVAKRAGDDAAVAIVLLNLGSGAGELRRYALADRWLAEAVAWTTARDLDSNRGYALAWQSRILLEQGSWAQAAALANEVVGGRCEDVPTHIVALTVLGLLRVRRGEPDAEAPLDTAHDLARRAGDLQRIWPVAAALAERAWLAGAPERIEELVAEPYQLAVDRRHEWAIGELGHWLRIAGSDIEIDPLAARPFALQLAGDPVAAAHAWWELGCPYEAATALAAADNPDQQLAALAELHRLGAKPAAALLAKRLRAQGIRRLPRGPRRTTREHHAQLTNRETEILDLLTTGLRNTDIATRLHISTKTVDNHVSAILAKLGVRSRHDAANWARQQS